MRFSRLARFAQPRFLFACPGNMSVPPLLMVVGSAERSIRHSRTGREQWFFSERFFFCEKKNFFSYLAVFS
jgi:hypothetical protein